MRMEREVEVRCGVFAFGELDVLRGRWGTGFEKKEVYLGVNWSSFVRDHDPVLSFLSPVPFHVLSPSRDAHPLSALYHHSSSYPQ